MVLMFNVLKMSTFTVIWFFPPRKSNGRANPRSSSVMPGRRLCRACTARDSAARVRALASVRIQPPNRPVGPVMTIVRMNPSCTFRFPRS